MRGRRVGLGVALGLGSILPIISSIVPACRH